MSENEGKSNKLDKIIGGWGANKCRIKKINTVDFGGSYGVQRAFIVTHLYNEGYLKDSNLAGEDLERFKGGHLIILHKKIY